MPLEMDILGTKRFGYRLARTTDTTASQDVLNGAAAALKVEMLTTRLDCSDPTRVHALEADGHRLMDSLVYYARSLATSAPSPTRTAIRLATPVDAARVGDVARLAFQNYLGHFHSDPQLDSASADAAYVEWAETSIRNVTIDRPALIAQNAGQIVGFLTLRRNTPDEWEIVLNAVDPNMQGKGIYGDLVTTAIEYAHRNVDTPEQARMITSTQLNNYSVQRVWSRKGFFIDHAFHTFHKWYRS